MPYGPTLPPGVKATLVVFIALGIVLANAFVVLAIVRASRTPSLRGFAKVLAMLLVCENIISLLLIVLLAFSVTDKWPYGNTFCHRTLLNSVACSLASLSAVIYVAIHPIRSGHRAVTTIITIQ
uniref:G-protein coupled receptors family 1 profile domain-containing protein n=1 Tax=Branchiostoma floridae TaxID=7739 RepID=C3Z6N8_BRAFL|eukprot:XP_002595786.1 hypothetical protein BRAFLDRAFT_131351 [Branchiostoma floridae]